MELNLNELERRAKSAGGQEWTLTIDATGDAFLSAENSEYVAEVGAVGEDGIVSDYGKFIAAANPAVVLELVRRLREAEARVAELEAERAEREKQEPALYVQSNHFAQAKFSPFLARVCQQPIEGVATMPLYAASTVTAQSEGQIDKATSLLRRAADYLGYAGAPRLASEISSYLESQAQPPRGEG